jgi:hypothetical protein
VEVNDYSIWCCTYNDQIQIEGILMPAALKYLVVMPACALLAMSASAQIATDVHGMPASAIIENNTSPMFGVTISTGYRQWELIGVAHKSGLDEVRGILGNAIALQAYLDGSLHFPDGTILAALAWKHSPLCEVDGPFVSGAAATTVQMDKGLKKHLSTGGCGFGRFINRKPVDEAQRRTCVPCHEVFVKG